MVHLDNERNLSSSCIRAGRGIAGPTGAGWSSRWAAGRQSRWRCWTGWGARGGMAWPQSWTHTAGRTWSWRPQRSPTWGRGKGREGFSRFLLWKGGIRLRFKRCYYSYRYSLLIRYLKIVLLSDILYTHLKNNKTSFFSSNSFQCF